MMIYHCCQVVIKNNTFTGTAMINTVGILVWESHTCNVWLNSNSNNFYLIHTIRQYLNQH